MATHAVIAYKTSRGFEGRFHEFDGYPSGLGQAIWRAYKGHFAGDLSRLSNFLFKEHPSGFNSFVGADLSLEIYKTDPLYETCMECGKLHWEHYLPYYANGMPGQGRKVPVWTIPNTLNPALILGHMTVLDPARPRPVDCRCHGTSKPGPEELLDHNTAAEKGCSYAYILAGKSLIMYKLSGATWDPITSVDLDRDEIDWKAIEQGPLTV